jgi:hypothetical protein
VIQPGARVRHIRDRLHRPGLTGIVLRHVVGCEWRVRWQQSAWSTWLETVHAARLRPIIRVPARRVPVEQAIPRAMSWRELACIKAGLKQENDNG